MDVDGNLTVLGSFSAASGGGDGSGDFYLNDLKDVSAPGPSNGEVLTFVSGNERWEPVAPTVSPEAGAFYLNDLKDVSAASPSDGQVLSFVSANSQWEPAAGGGGSGDFLADGTVSMTGAIKLSQGTIATNNGLTFAGDLDTGIQRGSFGDSLEFIAGAATFLTMGTFLNTVAIPSGRSLSVPAIIGGGGTNRPIRFGTANTTGIGATIGGSGSMQMAVDSTTLLSLNRTNNQVVLPSSSGSAASPQLVFSSLALSSGIRFAASTLHLTISGTDRLSVSASAITAAVNLDMGTNNITNVGTIAAGTGGDGLLYTVGVSGDWTGADPTNVKDALDRIAAALGPIA